MNLPRLRFRQGFLINSSALLGISVLAFFAGIGQAAQEDGADRRITAVRHWSLGDVTRIVIEATGEFRFKSDQIRNPDRVFFDLFGTRPEFPRQTGKGTTNIAVGDGFIKQIRVAETQHNVTRVVFDLEPSLDAIEYSTSQLANPDRLIIEFHSPYSQRLTSKNERSIERERSMEVERVEREIAANPRTPPRMAVLDFQFLRVRRAEWAQQQLYDIPSPPWPFDFSARVGRPFTKPDPLATALPLRAVGPIPYRATVARVLPPPPPLPSISIVDEPALPAITSTPLPGSTLIRTPGRGGDALPPITPTATLEPKSRPDGLGLPAKHAGADTMIRVLGLKLNRVVIDPGHGGHDNGTTGPDGIHEKDIVLDVARRLGALIQDRLGSEVVYTRSDDTFVPLTRRTAIANDAKADLFLSIHVNSSPVRSVAGVETYYLNFTTSKPALELAMRENAGADMNISELQDILKKIALKDKAVESKEFAARIQTSLVSLSPKSVRAARDRGVKRAPFVVLIGASMPSVLAEIGFITNSAEEHGMERPDHRQKLAEALFKGVSSYANSLSHFQVAQQSSRVAKTADSSPE